LKQLPIELITLICHYISIPPYKDEEIESIVETQDKDNKEKKGITVPSRRQLKNPLPPEIKIEDKLLTKRQKQRRGESLSIELIGFSLAPWIY